MRKRITKAEIEQIKAELSARVSLYIAIKALTDSDLFKRILSYENKNKQKYIGDGSECYWGEED